MDDPSLTPERRSIRCDWCGLIGQPHEMIVRDKLHLHKVPILYQSKACLSHYEDYCRWIRDKCD